MKPECTKFIQSSYEGSEEWKKVVFIADEIFDFISSDSIQNEIKKANKPGVNSKQVQNVIMQKASQLGFTDECSEIFEKTINKLRPDFYLNIGNTGIIIEVERGRTNQNNMDFLDFWKCHICDVAHYLFIFVPLTLIQNSSTNKIVGYPYKKVISHMTPFFYEKNYTNVRGVVIYGY